MTPRTLHLLRFAHLPTCTLGYLKLGTWLGVTIELPWRDNQHNISCIPLGTYPLSVLNDPERGLVFYVHDVPERDGVLIHPGAHPSDTKGCILPGLRYNWIEGEPWFSTSRLALDSLLSDFQHNGPFSLSVELHNPYGENQSGEPYHV